MDGGSNGSATKHPSVGDRYHLMPAHRHLHGVHQQRGHRNSLLTRVGLNGEFTDSEGRSVFYIEAVSPTGAGLFPLVWLPV